MPTGKTICGTVKFSPVSQAAVDTAKPAYLKTPKIARHKKIVTARGIFLDSPLKFASSMQTAPTLQIKTINNIRRVQRRPVQV